MDWTLPENLQRLKGIAEQATPGPWHFDGLQIGSQGSRVRYLVSAGVEAPTIFVESFCYTEDEEAQHEVNAHLILAAREALPQLIYALEKARGGH